VESVREKHEINRSGPETGDVIGVPDADAEERDSQAQFGTAT
jgi:hypothetical protein